MDDKAPVPLLGGWKPFYAILISIPNKLLGVLAMFGSLLILLNLPLTDVSSDFGIHFPINRYIDS